MSRLPFFLYGDAATEAPDNDEADRCPSCGHEWEGTTRCRSCGYGEPEPAKDAQLERAGRIIAKVGGVR